MKKITLWLFALLTSWQINAQFGCSSALVIADGYTASNITTPGNGGVEDWNDNPTGTSISANYWDDDVYLFQYTAGATDEFISMTINSVNSWNGIGIFTTCTGNTFSGELDAEGTTGANSTKTVSSVVTAGQTVYIAVGQWGTPNGLNFSVTNFSVISTTSAPDCTSIISPADGANNVSSGLITWSPVVGLVTGYKLNVGTSAGATDVLNGADVGNVTSYNIGTLTGSTTYYVTIIPYNANGDATGCTETSFSSCFINVAPWTYDVETAAATTNSTIADCWSSNPTGTTSAFRWDVDASGGTPSGTSTGPSEANSGVKYFYTEATSGTTGAVAELYTPFVDLSGLTEPTLQFYYHMRGVNMGSLHIDVFDGTTWANDVLVISGQQQTAALDPWALSIVSLNAFADNTVQVRFRGIRGAGFESDMSLDDISFEEAPSCFDPINLGVSNVTANSFDLLFTDASGGNQFDFYYVVQPQGTGAPATFPAGDYEDGSNTLDGNDYVIPVSSLNSNTDYEIYVAADCNGNWVGPFNFTTACSSFTIPYFENFDAYSAGSTTNNNTPDCWSYLENTGGAGYGYISSTTPNSAPRNFYLFNSSDATGNYMLVSPSTIDLSTGLNRTRFYARAGGANYTVEVGTLSDSSDPSTFTLIQSIPITTAYTQYTVNIPIGTDNYLAFRHGLGGTSRSVYLDDIHVEAIPTTSPDCATNIVATPDVSCGNFANQITWDLTPNADGYYITIGTTPGGNDVADAVNLINPSYSFSGTLNTTYYYTVVPYNSFNSATGCVEQSFTTAATGCYCSPSSTSSSTYVDNFTTTGGSQNISNLSTGFTTGGYLDSSAQFVESFATSSFDFNAAIVGGTAGFSIWVDWNNDLNFDNATEKVFNTTAYGSGPFTGTITIPAGTPIGNYRMRITTDWNSSNPSNPCTAASRAEFEDYTITVIAPPSCVAPSGLNVTSVSASSANLGWIENGTASSWDVEWGTLGFTPTGTPTISGASNPEVISGLSPNTNYSFYVRANCGVDGFSSWSGPFNFTTSCIAEDVPYSQNFESATIPNLPTCTSQQNVGSGNLWTVVNNPGYGFTTNALRYSWNTSNAANVWFFTNGVNLVGGTTYKISYDYGSASSSYVESLRVSYGSSATAVGMTDLLAEHPTVNNNVTPINNEIEFTPATSGVYYFGFNAYSIANQFNLYVDNILVDVALSSNTFDNNNFTAYPNPVKDILNLSYTSEITSVRVINMLGQEVIARSLNATNAQVDMSQLSAGTYIVNVTIGDTVKTIKVVKQ
jgi:hypothetical protein